MKNITWYSTNKDLSVQREEVLSDFSQAEKIIVSYVEKWTNIDKYTSSDEYQSGDGTDILSQTSFYFYSDDGSKLDINMGEKYQVEFSAKKSESFILSWLKYKKNYETTDLAELKSIVKNFFELDRESFKNYLDGK